MTQSMKFSTLNPAFSIIFTKGLFRKDRGKRNRLAFFILGIEGDTNADDADQYFYCL